MKRHIPKKLKNLYHLAYAEVSALKYRYPSRKLVVIGVTGTKGKSSVAEIVRALLTEAGHKVALTSTIHFMLGEEVEPNLYKMSMPGHGFLQQFLRRAVDAHCTHAVIEMTSEGAVQFRHRGLALDALIFTNLQPEHIESHGSMAAYARAKLMLAQGLLTSPKRPRIIVANADDAYGARFLETPVEVRAPFRLTDAEPYQADDRSVRFVFRRELFEAPLPGVFNLRNILAALTLGEALGLPLSTMKRALKHLGPIAGRAERVEVGQDFTVVVDYAHTPDSLRALLETYKEKRILCIMGSTGGGRDQWKRPEMGAIADRYASEIWLTNEDPYDEDPEKIIEAIAKGFTAHTPHVVLNRRLAIAGALAAARPGDVVLITGKGTDPYIMGSAGTREPWSDRKVAEEELHKLLKKRS